MKNSTDEENETNESSSAVNLPPEACKDIQPGSPLITGEIEKNTTGEPHQTDTGKKENPGDTIFAVSPTFSFLPPPLYQPPKPPTKGKRTKVLIITLVPAITSLILALTLSGLYSSTLLPNIKQRPFSIYDPNISKPYLPETVTDGGLIGIVFVVGMASFGCAAIGGVGSIGFGRKDWEKRAISWVTAVCVTAALLDVLVVALKVGVAEMRPDFISRCVPDVLTLECTNTNLKMVAEGCTSFPSGHASWSMYACGMLSALAGQITLGLYNMFAIRQKRSLAVVVSVVGSLLALSSLIPGIVVSVSRVSDNRHFTRDVLTGAVFGVLAAAGCYTLYRVYSIQIKSAVWKRQPPPPPTNKSLSIVDEAGELEWAKDIEDQQHMSIIAPLPSPITGLEAAESLSFRTSSEVSTPQ